MDFLPRRKSNLSRREYFFWMILRGCGVLSFFWRKDRASGIPPRESMKPSWRACFPLNIRPSAYCFN